MTEQRRWRLILAATCLALAILMQLPQFLYQHDPRTKGLMVQFNSDESLSLARVEEALNGRPEQSGEAFIGDPSLKGSESGLPEAAIGTVFRPFQWRADIVLQILNSIVPPLLFLVFFAMLLAAGFSRKQAFFADIVFVLLEFSHLNQSVNPGFTTLLACAAVFGIMRGMEGKTVWGIIGSVLLGLLLGISFWSWTFAWLWFALLIAWEVFEWFRPDLQPIAGNAGRMRRLALFTLIALAAALPFFWQLIVVWQNPLFVPALVRSGAVFSHDPESWVYSVLFGLMFVCSVDAVKASYDELRRHRYAVLFITTAFLAINQQIIHGITFKFVSGYLLFLVLAAVMALLLAITARQRMLWLAGFAAVLYLAAIGYGGRAVFEQIAIQDARFGEQHFAGLLPALEHIDRTTILSDPDTSTFLAGFTKHDVVYSPDLKTVLLSDDELAERSCLSQLPGSSEDRCRAEAADPAKFLAKYHVRYLLWDEERHPEWNVQKLNLNVAMITKGTGWSLWLLP